ncbi:ATP phosphoribosyltransferase [Sulfobacillus sp. hq2]|uniref:ATP phosphoribosyltransferase n=1 Tax=Sulfobacillus TaxID=28033 RepID=UPI000CD061ED|nr:ATP phosphoribosyltransferase [Sulfobacillus sp. hq2]POB11636.1 ATP phosphoribosyltransferase [Sulfobacillus sp. hq2]
MTFDNVTVAVAKGRILEGAETLWEQQGLPWPIDKESRKLWFSPEAARPGMLIARARDIPTFVAMGIADLGIVGLDVLEEHPNAQIIQVADLHFATCRVVLAGKERQWPAGPTRIATKYQRIAQAYFAVHHHPVEIVPLSGSLELAPVIGLAPYIVDIVDTGSTLRQHQLVEIATIMESSARLIANPSHWRTKPALEHLRNRLNP